MARIARVVVAGVPHHITQRGNRRETVFFSDSDRIHFLLLLEKYARREGLEVLSYCLMDNHLHIVAVPEADDSLARTLKPVNLMYARYVNERKGWCGRLWQERFYSCPMDGQHCLIAARYVELNPVRAGLVRRAEEYPWSSAAGHTGKRADPLLSDRQGWLAGIDDWGEWLNSDTEFESVERLRMSTRTGRPLGSGSFVASLERRLGRRLEPQSIGRPKKRRDGENG